MIAHREAELAVLGTLILADAQAEALATVGRVLPEPGMFADPRHRTIYRAIREIADEGTPLDHITLGTRLAVHHAAAGVTPDYLADLVDVVPSLANLPHHAQLVRDRWQRRQVIEHAEAAKALAADLTVPITETVRGTVDRLGQTHHAPTRAIVPMTTGLLDVMEDLERQAQLGPVLGVPSGLPDLDTLTHGFQPGELWVLGARPSTGKSSFVVDAALATAEVGPVLFCSAEMPAKALRRRMLSRASGINLWTITSAEAWRHNTRVISAAAASLGQLPIRVDDSRTTPADIRLACSEWAAEMGRPPALVVVDYLQKLTTGRRVENRNIEIGYMTTALARLAIDLDVPVLCAAQLSRSSVRDGKPRRPNMSDLRDSGNIEQDADGVLLLHCPPPPDLLPPYTWLTEVIVEKNRNGDTGLLPTYHDRSTGRWRALDRHEVKQLRAAA